MKYLDVTLGFSFELPDDWRVVRELSLLLTNGSSEIDVTITRIRAELVDRGEREKAYLAYLRSLNLPFAQVSSGCVGGETNVIVGHDPRARITSISVVHDNAHFQIGFTGTPDDPAVAELCRSFRFSPIARIDAFMAAREPCDTRVSQLLDQIDGGSEDARQTLLAMGHDAIDGIKKSAGQINERIHSITNDRGWCSPPSADQLRPLFYRFACRLYVLGQLGDPGSVRLLADAVADAVIAGSQFTDASVVVDAGSDALAQIGKDALSIVKTGTHQPDTSVARAFQKILKAIQRSRTTVSGRRTEPCGSRAQKSFEEENGSQKNARQKAWEKRVPEFWFREGRLRGAGSPAYQKLQTLGMTAAHTAQHLRQRWLTTKAADVEERLRWAEQHVPPAALFARIESALSRLIDSAGNMHRSAYGGLGVKDSDVRHHVDSIIELDRIVETAQRAISSGPSKQVSADMLGDLKRLMDQINDFLSHLSSVYRRPPFPLVGCIGIQVVIAYFVYRYSSH